MSTKRTSSTLMVFGTVVLAIITVFFSMVFMKLRSPVVLDQEPRMIQLVQDSIRNSEERITLISENQSLKEENSWLRTDTANKGIWIRTISDTTNR